MRKANVRQAGRKCVHAARSAKRVNWSAPFIWSQIHNSAVATGRPWSATLIVKRLRQLDPETFATLSPQRISQWRDHTCPDILKWTDSHLRTVAQGHQPHSNSTRIPLLVRHGSQTCQILSDCYSRVHTQILLLLLKNDSMIFGTLD